MIVTLIDFSVNGYGNISYAWCHWYFISFLSKWYSKFWMQWGNCIRGLVFNCAVVKTKLP